MKLNILFILLTLISCQTHNSINQSTQELLQYHNFNDKVIFPLSFFKDTMNLQLDKLIVQNEILSKLHFREVTNNEHLFLSKLDFLTGYSPDDLETMIDSTTIGEYYSTMFLKNSSVKISSQVIAKKLNINGFFLHVEKMDSLTKYKAEDVYLIQFNEKTLKSIILVASISNQSNWSSCTFFKLGLNTTYYSLENNINCSDCVQTPSKKSYSMYNFSQDFFLENLKEQKTF